MSIEVRSMLLYAAGWSTKPIIWSRPIDLAVAVSYFLIAWDLWQRVHSMLFLVVGIALGAIRFDRAFRDYS